MNLSYSRSQVHGDHLHHTPLHLQTIQGRTPFRHVGAPSSHNFTNKNRLLRKSVITQSYVGELATYRLPQHTSISSWFNQAIQEAVRNLSHNSQPFIELVQFQQDNKTKPKITSFTVNQSVVAAPELWSSIAATVSSEAADVLILVQKVEQQDNQQPEQNTYTCDDDTSSSNTSSQSPLERIHKVNSEMRRHVEDACRQLVASGIGESILQGQVGECCDGDDTHYNSKNSSSMSLSTTVVDTNNNSSREVTALPSTHQKQSSSSPSPSPSSFSGYWGVVVQSRHHTLGVEGCYLLKAIRTIGKSPGECTCTHFSLTRVCQGENLEKQFVQSWLV